MWLGGCMNALIEPGASRAFGAWVEGHHDSWDVVGAVAADFGRDVDQRTVRRGYCRKLRGAVHFTDKAGRGAMQCTWVEW